MADPICPTYTGAPAVSMVADGITLHKAFATSAFAIATNLIGTLIKVADTDPVSFAVTYDVPVGLLQPFVAPTAPVAPDAKFDESKFFDPGDVPKVDIGDPSTTPTPAFTATPRPPIQKFNPGDFTTPPPDPSFTPTAVALPADLSVTNPTAPTLFPITLPTQDPVNIPEFQGTAPVVDFTVPTGNITFASRAYASTLLDDVRARLASIVNNGLGLPVPIENALFSRARGREDVIAAKAVMEAREEAAAMGHTLPPGSLMAAIKEARQNNANNASAANRDIFIQLSQLEQKNIMEAVTQCVSLEGQLINADLRAQELDLQANRLQLDASVQIFNSNAALFNARGQLYAIQAQVLRDRIAAEQLKVDVYKAQIDAQRLVGEVNKDLIAIYEAQQRTVTNLIEQYKARWEAIKIITGRDTLVLEQDRLQLQIYDTEISAWSKKWDVTLKQYDADAANGRLFESQVNGYAALTNAIVAGNKNQIDIKELSLKKQLAMIDAWKAKLERLKTDIEAERDRIQAAATIFDGQAKIYSAAGEVARNQSDANLRQVQVILEGLRSKSDIALKNVELQIQQLVELQKIRLGVTDGAVRGATQLVAGAMTGLSFSAHAQDSNATQSSVSCDTRLDFTGNLTG